MTTPRNHTTKDDYDPILLGLSLEDIHNLETLRAQVTLLFEAYQPVVRKAMVYNLAVTYGYKVNYQTR
jgi:hypothetical protein